MPKSCGAASSRALRSFLSQKAPDTAGRVKAPDIKKPSKISLTGICIWDQPLTLEPQQRAHSPQRLDLSSPTSLAAGYSSNFCLKSRADPILFSGGQFGIISSSLTFTAFFWLGGIFGITTPLQLFELARPTHPLARRLLLEAPGTYHHSLIVGNLGERAAELVGADPLLVRVAALHHDVGKVLRPYFFVENQASGENYHQQLDPKTSAQIIISHVKDSLELGRKYHFPTAVLDIIGQHHGTTSAGFGHFYQRASKEMDGDVNEVDFRYPGPRPRSKEAAIIMLADRVEAAVRASAPESSGEMERLVRKITNDRLVSGELDECDVTLRDLEGIRGAFIDVLQGVFHPRLQYPEKDSMTQTQQRES